MGDHWGRGAGRFAALSITEVMAHATRQAPALPLVTAGHAVPALVRNSLGFVTPQLSRVPHGFQPKPSARLSAPGMQASPRNEDTRGHTLNTLYDAGGDRPRQAHGRHGGHALGPEANGAPSP